MRKLALQLTLLAVVAFPVLAQKPGRPPKRPKLAAPADSNDARAYLDFGIKTFEDDPGRAGDAFYWAAQLDPAEAEAYDGRRAALIISDRRWLRAYLSGSRRDREGIPEFRTLDSLQLRALLLKPFLYRRFEFQLFQEYNHCAGIYRMECGLPTDDAVRAWVSYADGHFDDALDEYASAMKSQREKAPYHVERARIFGMRTQADSAIAEFDLALEEMRARDAKSLVYVYESKAAIEYSIGILEEAQDRPSDAREAYGRALQEDVAFYPAHLRLGLLALTANDTASAISELDLATQLAGAEPYVRYTYGFTLAAAGHRDEALKQLAKAVELDPYYPLPYLAIARLEETRGDKSAAQAAYRAFLNHASRHDPQRPDAEQRLVASLSPTDRP
ncbi:MAG: hypothetical protein ACREN6_16885 [Gemmatimonadaceae bacterium]